MSNVVPVGITAPNVLRIPITQGDSALDLTTVTAISLTVGAPDGTETTWNATILAGATSLALTAQHVFAAADVPKAGIYRIIPMLTTASGVTPCHARSLNVQEKFSV